MNRPWLERIIGYCDDFGVPRGTLVEVGPGFGTFAATTANVYVAQHIDGYKRGLRAGRTP